LIFKQKLNDFDWYFHLFIKSRFFELFQKYGGTPEINVKLKRPKQLQEVLDIARFLLSEGQNAENKDVEIEEKRSKLDQLKSVLEMYGYFSGINRKVQLKYQPKGRPRGSSSDDGKHFVSLIFPMVVVQLIEWNAN